MKLKDWLKIAKIGEKLKLHNNCEGVVIEGYNIRKKCVVNGKAFLITKYSSGNKWYTIAEGFLGNDIKNKK